jgi:membrane-anchored protein YejM (alkaline phosphatase superfamily)
MMNGRNPRSPIRHSSFVIRHSPAILAAMPAPNILVVVIDGLRASSLGAYGNTTYPTPALDRFAADSFLLDACYAPAPELDAIYRALWLSAHNTDSLPRQLAANGYHTSLVSDEPAVASLVVTDHFDERLDVSAHAHPATRANDASQTTLAHVFATACDVVASTRSASPRLVWLHTRGMYGPWDAPLELQRSLLDEGDPSPIEAVTPPDFSLTNSDDPDAAFRFGCGYAAQVIVLDSCWEILLGAVESAGAAEPWLVMLLGARGLALGEHRRIGGVDPRMYVEQLHVPWLIRFPDGLGRLARSNRLVSHVDLLPTLLDSIPAVAPPETTRFDGSSVRRLALSSRPAWRDALISTSPTGHRAIRTAEWCLRRDAPPHDEATSPANSATASPRSELYVRPDDRWEANDVAKLCPDVVETLTLVMEDELKRLGPAS